MSLERVATIGVYGFDADRFFATIQRSRIDLFCDLRARRGVRGSEYAFANAHRLEERLATLGIPYRHFPALAPTDEARALQHEVDAAAGRGQRTRVELSPAFVEAYERRMQDGAAQAAVEEIRASCSAPLLFCVERVPEACHRSLAALLIADGSVPVEHLLP